MQRDQTFQFVSDPNHKENLSGRVTAACLNCRQKKIKCSGEVGCRQCREKGLVCEGPPSRKRPRRDNVDDFPGEGVSGPSALSTKNPALDPNSTMTSDRILRPLTISQQDSGYISIRRESPSSNSSSTSVPPRISSESPGSEPGRSIRPLPNRRPQPRIAPASSRSEDGASPSSTTSAEHSPYAFVQPLADHGRGQITASPAMMGSREWSPASREHPQGSSAHALMANRTSSMPTFQTTRSAVSVMPEVADTSSQHHIAGMWPDNSQAHASPHQLFHAVDMLESQASTLRRLASRRRSLDPDALMPPQQLSHSAQLSNAYQVEFGTFDPTTSQTPYQFDTASIFRPDGTLRFGLTPSDDGYEPWYLDFQQPPFQQQAIEQPHMGRGMASEQPNVHPPPRSGLATQGSASDVGTVSSRSPMGGTGAGRMQRAFKNQLGLGGDHSGFHGPW